MGYVIKSVDTLDGLWKPSLYLSSVSKLKLGWSWAIEKENAEVFEKKSIAGLVLAGLHLNALIVNEERGEIV